MTWADEISTKLENVKEIEFDQTEWEIKNQINTKARQKIVIQWLTSKKIRKNPKEIARDINYCMGFMKIEEGIKGEEVWKIVNEVIEDTLVPIPETPEEVPQEIKSILPFELPVKNRGNL
ncbi:hypothetical protein F8M41_011901 [Gigaspora margarita]|uniref:Uncharacterized protein n=1 Tax=Gigaspora margarita TaxID=4874 RepID=A0A8H4ATL7_GIGMA|nr:hypothetical protein F8M41_011901 [Gigaspora margarita]